LLDEVLPRKAALIFAAADAVPVGRLSPAAQQRFFRRVLAVLAERGETHSADQYLLQARTHARLDETAAAQTAYETALKLKPRSVSWRLEFGEFLHGIGQSAKARQELILLLDQEPGNRAAQDLRERVLRELAER
jgi:hypothetical protein